jgi:O-antigen/teichoic acid export membrane protein
MSRLKINIIYNLIGQTSLVVLSFVSVKYIYQQLGQDALGLIYFTAMFNSLLSAALGLGIETVLIREIAAHFNKDEKDEQEYIHRLIQTASFIFWTIFLLLSLCVYFLAPIIVSQWINLESISEETAIYVLRILGIASLVSFPQSVYSSLFNGLQRMEYTNIIQVAITLLQQIGIITIIMLDGSLIKVSYWIAGCSALLIIVFFRASTRFLPIKALVPHFFVDVIKKNFSFSVKMGWISVLTFIHTQADKIVISKFLPIGALGYYSILYGMLSKTVLLVRQVSKAAYPAFCDLFESGKHRQMLTSYKKLQDMVCYSSVPLFAFVIFYNQIIFSYLFDINVAKMLLMPVMFLCAAYFLQVAFLIPYRFMLATGEADIVVKLSSFNLLFSLPTAIISIYFLGLTGAGFAFFLSRLFNLFYGVPKLSRQCLKLSSVHWYLHIIKVFLLFMMSYSSIWLILHFSQVQSISGITIGYMVASILFLGGAWFLIGNEFKSSLINMGMKVCHFIKLDKCGAAG